VDIVNIFFLFGRIFQIV